jgi:dienelactone hydrolase
VIFARTQRPPNFATVLSHEKIEAFRMIALALFIAATAAAAAPQTSLPMQPGFHTGIVLTEASPLASTAEILRRAFTPLTAQHVAAVSSIAGEPIDLSRESFAIYVPTRKPPQGYALLVFVPPWDRAKIPAGWATVLDDKGVIFVSADQSGNEMKVETRRMPLAVIAAQQLMHDYGVDPSRVLVGGFSGGSRVALRLALAYPDVFRGALLNSDSDPIGTPQVPLPPAELLHQFQERSRIYYLSGDLDLGAKSMQAASESSLQKWCVLDVRAAAMYHTGHATADQRSLSRALDALLDLAPASHEGLAECRAHVQSELASDGQRIESLIASGDKVAARQALNDLNAKFGGLATDRMGELEKTLN